jgi:hypothetical protein
LLMVQSMKIDPVVDVVIENLFKSLVARAPRRPSVPVPIVPNYERVILPFGRMRKRWRRPEPIPRDTETFASILKEHGVYIFAVEKSHIECQAAQNRIARALGS